MKISSWKFNRANLNRPPCCHTVTFAGGFGAQLLSMAVCLDMQSDERGIVSADLSYFESASRLASPGDGASSTWPWALEAYGFSFQEVSRMGIHDCRNPRVLGDTPEKLLRGITALQNPGVAEHFMLRDKRMIASELGVEPSFMTDNFIAFHMRRGDYLNVSSRVLPDSLFLRAATRLGQICRKAIIFSDSKLSDGTVRKFEASLPELIIYDNGALDPFLIHQTIRHASVLVGSNSQFSLVSGLLGTGVYLNPRNWFGRDGLDQVPNQLGDFNIVF